MAINKVILSGRLTGDPEIRYSPNQNGEQMAVAHYSLAVDRRGKDNGADFIRCTAFGKTAEFVEKYLKKGMKMMIVGRIQTGSYTDKDGKKVYTTDVIVEEHEFADSKNQGQNGNPAMGAAPTFDNGQQQNFGGQQYQQQTPDFGGGFQQATEPNPFDGGQGQPNPFNTGAGMNPPMDDALPFN